MTTTKVKRKYSFGNIELAMLSISGFPAIAAIILAGSSSKSDPQDIVGRDPVLYNTFLWGGILFLIVSLVSILILVSRRTLDNYEDTKQSIKKDLKAKKESEKDNSMSYFSPKNQIKILNEFVDFVDRPEFHLSLELKVQNRAEKITLYEPFIRGAIKKVLMDKIIGYERMENRSSPIPEGEIDL